MLAQFAARCPHGAAALHFHIVREFLRVVRKLARRARRVGADFAAHPRGVARRALRLPNIPPRYRVAAGLGGLTLGAGVAVLAAVRILDMRRRGKAQISLSI